MRSPTIRSSALGSTYGTRRHGKLLRFWSHCERALAAGILPVRMLLRRLGSRGLAVFATCAAFGAVLASASAANADSTQYLAGRDCINFQVGQHVQNNTGYPLLQGLLDDTAPTVSGGTDVHIPRPVNVYYYRGTANLYWAPYVKIVNNQTGASAAGQVNQQGFGGAYPWRRVWRASNGWLTNLWWNQQSPQTEVGFFLPPGFTAYVWGTTYWLNSSGRWFRREYHYYGVCRA